MKLEQIAIMWARAKWSKQFNLATGELLYPDPEIDDDFNEDAFIRHSIVPFMAGARWAQESSKLAKEEKND